MEMRRQEGIEQRQRVKLNPRAEKDKIIIKVVKKMKKAEVKVLRGDEYKIEEDLVLKEGKVYILKDEELRLEVI